MAPQAIAHYRITSKLGQGGMGEVYRATDTKLGREVAIKILPEAFAQDGERLARFTREAHLLASLNHPNIAAIYGLEDRALVMELVEGPTLAERIAHGPIPLEEALEIARQIAGALEAAHEKGIVHRDLKPANVKVTPGGAVKVLDFGLAKAAEPEMPAGGDTISPTLTMGATQMGVLLGTAAYMSPEQARGKPVDKRTDIWAFGVVLYEMLTGRRLFDGPTVSDVLAAVLKAEPDWDRVPSRVRPLLRSCLEKDARQRLRDIGDAWKLLAEAPPNIRGQKTAWLPWAALVLLVSAVAAWALLRSPPAEPRPVSRWTLPIAATDPGAGFGVSLSRDGTHLAYTERRAGASQIVVRSLDQTEARPVVGSQGALRPFFSPDGRWLAYFTGSVGPIKKISIDGGTPVTLCEDASWYGGSWGEDDRIVFAGGSGNVLMQALASEGKCETISAPDRQMGETSHRWPQILPGGRALLFSISIESNSDARIVALDRASGIRRVLVNGATGARYVPSGHLVYVRRGILFAAPFDLKKLAITGPEAPVIEGVYFNASAGFADYTFSDSGLLLYIPETRLSSLPTLDWIDRSGASRRSPASPQRYAEDHVSRYGSEVRLSPDGQRAAVTIWRSGGDIDIWIADLIRGTLIRLTSGGISYHPVWNPDGTRVAFFHYLRGEGFGIYWAPADGSAKPELLVDTGGAYAFPDSWTPDGKKLLYESGEPGRIWIFTLSGGEGAGKPEALFEAAPFNEGEAQLSPDGRWLAYTSDDSGRSQVYARPFPGPGEKVPISIDSGETPRWSRDGRELFYLDPASSQVMAVDIEERSSQLRAGQPHALFSQPLRDWDVTPDGKSFLVRRLPQTEQNQAKLQVVVNWFEELRRKVPSPARK